MKTEWTTPSIAEPLDATRLIADSLQKLHETRKKLREALAATGGSAMISRQVRTVGSYTITRDELGQYSLLDSCAREVASGPDLDAMESAAKFLQGVIPVPEAA